MKNRWKSTNTIAVGIVISSAAAILIAEAPIALVETQAYAVAAAAGAAELLERVSAESGDDLRAFAGDLVARGARPVLGPRPRRPLPGHGAGPPRGPRRRSRQQHGPRPRHRHAHRRRERPGRRRLSGPDLLGPFGVGTLGRGNPAYNPIGYHTGSVWTHDTAISALGLVRAGHTAAAAAVLRALVDAATHFDFRFPELFGGSPESGLPVPCPASCRPQAWSAASAGALVTASLGLDADVPRGCLRVRPLRPAPFGDLRVRGLRVRGEPVEIDLDEGGDVREVRAPAWLDVQVG